MQECRSAYGSYGVCIRTSTVLLLILRNWHNQFLFLPSLGFSEQKLKHRLFGLTSFFPGFGSLRLRQNGGISELSLVCREQGKSTKSSHGQFFSGVMRGSKGWLNIRANQFHRCPMGFLGHFMDNVCHRNRQKCESFRTT